MYFVKAAKILILAKKNSFAHLISWQSKECWCWMNPIPLPVSLPSSLYFSFIFVFFLVFFFVWEAGGWGMLVLEGSHLDSASYCFLSILPQPEWLLIQFPSAVRVAFSTCGNLLVRKNRICCWRSSCKKTWKTLHNQWLDWVHSSQGPDQRKNIDVLYRTLCREKNFNN